MIALAENAPVLFSDFFIEPLPLLRATFADLLVIDKMMKELEKALPPADYANLSQIYRREVIVSICENKPDGAQKIREFKIHAHGLIAPI